MVWDYFPLCRVHVCIDFKNLSIYAVPSRTGLTDLFKTLKLTQVRDRPICRWKVIVPATFYLLSNTLQVSCISSCRIQSSQPGSNTVARTRAGMKSPVKKETIFCTAGTAGRIAAVLRRQTKLEPNQLAQATPLPAITTTVLCPRIRLRRTKPVQKIDNKGRKVGAPDLKSHPAKASRTKSLRLNRRCR